MQVGAAGERRRVADDDGGSGCRTAFTYPFPALTKQARTWQRGCVSAASVGQLWGFGFGETLKQCVWEAEHLGPRDHARKGSERARSCSESAPGHSRSLSALICLPTARRGLADGHRWCRWTRARTRVGAGASCGCFPPSTLAPPRRDPTPPSRDPGLAGTGCQAPRRVLASTTALRTQLVEGREPEEFKSACQPRRLLFLLGHGTPSSRASVASM